MNKIENNSTDPKVLNLAIPTTTTTFQKTNRLSVTEYGHVCLPKPIYKMLHAAWGKTKTVGNCRIGDSCFECYVDWVESKKVWMLRLKKAKAAVSEFRTNHKLNFQLEIGANSFGLVISATPPLANSVSGNSPVAPLITRRKSILPFHEAREYVRALGLTSMQDWIDYSKSGYRPKFIPSNPWIAYRGEYSSINDFIGGTAPRRTAVLTGKGVGR